MTYSLRRKRGRLYSRSGIKALTASCGRAQRLVMVWLFLDVFISAVCPASDAPNGDRSRVLLSQVAFRDRQQQVLLQRSKDLLHEGRTAEALQLLQQVLAAPQDSFMWLGTPRRLVSVRESAMSLINSAGPAVWRVYERLFGAESQNLLAEANRSNDPTRFDTLARRFPATEAAYEALSWRLSWWLDHGRYGLAARCADHLLRWPVYRLQLKAETLQKMAAAYVWGGRAEKLQELLRQFGDRVVPADGLSVPLRQWVEQLPAAPTPHQRDWLGPGGDPEHNRVSSGSPPLLRPLWWVLLDAPDGADPRVVEWSRMARESVAEPWAVANSPVVVGGQLVVRDFAGIRAIDVRTGRTVWRYDSEVGWSRLISQFVQTYQQGLSEFEAAFLGNSTYASLTSDGTRVYAIEFSRTDFRRSADVPVLSPIAPFRLRAAPVDDQALQWVRWNRLIALPLVINDLGTPDKVVRVRPVWSVGGPPDSRAPLAGHYFLTPPLAVDGRLYVLAESQRQLKLLALTPSSGQLVWSQTVALADTEISHPSQRSRRLSSAFLAFANGLILCPTDLGVLVAVDGVTSQLRWVYPYREPNGAAESRLPWMVFRNQRRVFGQPGIPPLLHVRGDRVVFAPRDSQFIHCIEVESGREMWRVPRESALYVGTVTDDRVVVVGDSAVWALSLRNGQRLWSTETGMPAGRGMAVDGLYLVPLKSGQIAAVDVQTGQLQGFSVDLETVRALPWPAWLAAEKRQAATKSAPAGPGRPTAAEATSAATGESPSTKPSRPSETKSETLMTADTTADENEPPANSPGPLVGNLVAYGDMILAVGPRRAVAFPQAKPLLHRLLAHSDGSPLAGRDAVLAAALWLTLGNLEQAEQLLEANRSVETAHHQLVDQLLTELLYIKLDRGLGDPSLLLHRLGQLAVTTRQKQRYLKRRIEDKLRQEQFLAALQSVRQLAALGTDGPLPELPSKRYRVQTGAWLGNVTRQARHHLSDEQLNKQSSQLLSEIRTAVRRADVQTLKTLATVYADWPEADEARLRLAELLLAQGKRQQVELLLLQARRSQSEQIAGAATAELLALYDRAGFHVEAARLLEELAGRFRDVPVKDGLTGQLLAAQFPRTSVTWLAYQRRLPVRWPVRRVVVKQRVLLQPERGLLEAYGRYRRRYRTDWRFPFHLLEYDLVTQRTLSIVDAQSGRLWGQKTVPSRNSYQFWARTPVIGHLLVMGRPGGFCSFSLFNRNTSTSYWDQTLAALKHTGEVPRPGPSGPGFCVFQSMHHLVALDPATGTVLWQRSDIAANSGLFADQMAGLFGDDQVLVLFGRMDPRTRRSQYTVYRTRTGEILRQGWLDVDPGVQRRVFGRKLFYVSNDPTARQVKIWDPLTGRVEWQMPYAGRLVAGVTPEDELVVITPQAHLLIRDVRSGRTHLNLKVPSTIFRRLGFVRAFRDKQRYYINLGSVPTGQPALVRSSLFSIDEFLLTQNFQGLVWAVDANTGKVLWQREFPQRTFLTLPDFNLPFLMARSRIREANNRVAKQMAIEIIAAETGETLAFDDRLLLDRMVHATYDPQAGRVELHGLQSTIEILFDRRRQAPLLMEQPL